MFETALIRNCVAFAIHLILPNASLDSAMRIKPPKSHYWLIAPFKTASCHP
ncbi:MAG: hypothetical protein U1B83_10010 [Candidatus Cloacimonadaceae bacterium]|nr:hypothetical protein [Candidatus Cloacimonadaceae bacterium]